MSQLVVGCRCGTRVRGTAGKKVRCPKCKAVLAIPPLAIAPASAAVPPAAPASRSMLWIVAGSCVTVALAVGVTIGVLASRREPALPTPSTQPTPIVVAQAPEAPPSGPVPLATPKTVPMPTEPAPKVGNTLSDLLKGSEAKVDPTPEKPAPEAPPAPGPKDDPAPPVEPKAQPQAADPVFTQSKAGGFAVETATITAGNLTYKVRRFQSYKEARRLRLAVTPRRYDNLGALLDQLGEGYRYDNITNQDLRDYQRLKDYQVVFLTCAAGGVDTETKHALRKFVEMGGTLYASDLRYDAVVAAFPEFKLARGEVMDMANAPPPKTPAAKNTTTVPPNSLLGILLNGAVPPGTLPGELPPGFEKDPAKLELLRLAGRAGQQVSADVVDSGLRQFLGSSQISLYFESPQWRPALFDEKKSTAYLVGSYKTVLGMENKATLLAKFRHGQGSVIFTSFHNATNSGVGKKLLEYLVFSAVNARAENDLTDLLLNLGFSLVDLKNVQLKEQGARVEEKYNHLGGSLQVAIGYESLGARLRLVMESPDGQRIEREEPGTFMIEAPNAKPGDWKISVVGSQVPFAHFPFLMAIAKGR